MLDTIRVKYPISPASEQLKYWIHRTSTSATGFRESYVYNPTVTENEVMLKYTYYPFDYFSHPLLALEVSLPKLIYGNNYQMLGSLDGTIKIGNILLATVSHAPILDLAEGILIRLDMCYNHQVGEAVDDYIKAIGNLEYPHRRTKYHRLEGAEFRAKHVTTKFYNKELETGATEAFGILRQETTLLDSKDVQKYFGKKNPTLLDIPYPLVREYLLDDLRKLGLLGNSIANRDTALKTLCDAEGEYAGVYYFGLQMSKFDKSKPRIVQETHTHPRSLDRRLKKIVVDGVPITFTDRDEPLPPLDIPEC